MSKIQDERTIRKGKPLIALLLVRPSMSKEVKPLHLFHQSTLKDFGNVLPFSIGHFCNEAFCGVMLLDYYHVPFVCERPYSFYMSCEEYMEIFNKLISDRPYAFSYLWKRALRVSRTLI